MPSINMIALRRAEKRRLERDMRRLMVVILAEIVCAIALGGWVCTKLITTRARISELDAQLARLQPIVKQIEEYENATRKLAPKIELLNEAKDRTMRWYNTLDHLTQSLPQSTYLTRLETKVSENKKDAGTTVSLTGISVSQARVGETILRLAAIPYFERVDLYYTQPNSIDGCQAIEFSVGAVMKGDEKPKGAKNNGRTQS